MHGDTVPVVQVGKPGTKSLEVLSWQSLLGNGLTMATKILMCAIFTQNNAKLDIDGVDTMDEIWTVLSWSFKALLTGRHPLTRWDGMAWPAGSAERMLADTAALLAGGLYGMIWGIQGDLVWFSQGLNLRDHSSNEYCDLCPCSRVHPERRMWPTYFKPDALWKTQLVSVSEWRNANPHMHVLFRTFVFLSAWNVEPDELHILYLGLLQYLLGSVLWIFVFNFCWCL